MGTHRTTKLLRLVAQLTSPGIEGQQMRKRWNEFPTDVMDDFDLGPEARHALLTMDKAAISAHLTKELLLWEFPKGEFPEGDPCVIPMAAPGIATAYNMPDPKFKAIVPANGASDTTVTVELYGEALLLPLRMTLTPQGGGPAVDYDDGNATFEVQADSTFRCGHIKLTCKLPKLTPNQNVVYDVTVTDLLGTAFDFLLKGNTAFTVNA